MAFGQIPEWQKKMEVANIGKASPFYGEVNAAKAPSPQRPTVEVPSSQKTTKEPAIKFPNLHEAVQKKYAGSGYSQYDSSKGGTWDKNTPTPASIQPYVDRIQRISQDLGAVTQMVEKVRMGTTFSFPQRAEAKAFRGLDVQPRAGFKEAKLNDINTAKDGYSRGDIDFGKLSSLTQNKNYLHPAEANNAINFSDYVKTDMGKPSFVVDPVKDLSKLPILTREQAVRHKFSSDYLSPEFLDEYGYSYYKGKKVNPEGGNCVSHTFGRAAEYGYDPAYLPQGKNATEWSKELVNKGGFIQTSTPKPGDIIVWDWYLKPGDGGHTAFVEDFDPVTGRYTLSHSGYTITDRLGIPADVIYVEANDKRYEHGKVFTPIMNRMSTVMAPAYATDKMIWAQ